VSGTTDLRGVSYDFAWSPDGARLAIAGQADDQWRIYVADLTQNSLKPVTLGIGDADSPSWAPAGDELAFCRDTPPGQHADPTSARVCVVTVDEGKERQVSARSAWRVAWSPDGRSLALSSTALYVVDPAGDREVQVTDPAEAGRTSVSDLDPKWSRDSRRIYFLRWDRGLPGDEAPVIRCLGLYSVSRDGGPARLVLEEVGINEFDV
jgi:Tol biopolymer transport system component